MPRRGQANASAVRARRWQAVYTYAQLNRWLHELLVALFGEAVASVLSWHSCRISLACRLREAGASDAIIQLLCRWKTPASVNEYAQIGTNRHISWLRSAEAAPFDALRARNIPVLDNSETYARLIAGDDGRRRAAAVVAAAAAPAPEAAAEIPPPLLASGERVEVLWGDRYFPGTFTSSKSDHAGGRRLHRINYDAIDGWRGQAHWHDLAIETWRRIA